MKKFIFLALFAIIALNANAYNYVSWCGKEFQTVPPDYFDNEADKKWFYDQMDIDLCGSTVDGRTDSTDHPAPTDEEKP